MDGTQQTVSVQMKQCLNESDNMMMEIEVLEFLLGSEDSEVDLRVFFLNNECDEDKRSEDFSNLQHESSKCITEELEFLEKNRNWKK